MLASLLFPVSLLGANMHVAMAAAGPCPDPVFIQSFDSAAATVCPRPEARFDYFGTYATSFGVLSAGSGGQTIQWTIASNGAPAASISVEFGSPSSNGVAQADFDGDGKFDVAVFDVTIGGFRYLPSSGGPAVTIGWSSNPGSDNYGVVGDYDCDGRSDPTYVRNVGGAMQWLINTSGPGPDRTVTFGDWATDSALAGMDWNGDGCDDLGTVRSGAGAAMTWRSANAGSGALLLEQVWGNRNTDFIIAGDYLGDERADFAVWRAVTAGTSGDWLIRENGGAATLTQVLGTPGTFAVRDIALRGDFDGDGKDDIAVKKNGSAIWQWRRSRDGTIDQTTVGTPTSFPIPAVGVL